jgi:hypothetical protein
MKAADRRVVVLDQVIDELANALQTAIDMATQVRRSAHLTADNSVLLEGSLTRAVSAIARLQPSTSRKPTRR